MHRMQEVLSENFIDQVAPDWHLKFQRRDYLSVTNAIERIRQHLVEGINNGQAHVTIPIVDCYVGAHGDRRCAVRDPNEPKLGWLTNVNYMGCKRALIFGQGPSRYTKPLPRVLMQRDEFGRLLDIVRIGLMQMGSRVRDTKSIQCMRVHRQGSIFGFPGRPTTKRWFVPALRVTLAD